MTVLRKNTDNNVVIYIYVQNIVDMKEEDIIKSQEIGGKAETCKKIGRSFGGSIMANVGKSKDNTDEKAEERACDVKRARRPGAAVHCGPRVVFCCFPLDPYVFPF